jgi:adenine-specific DNA-methyltransferase
MEKITKGHPLTQSPDFIKQNIETLKSLFPTILKEGKIDFEELKTLLDEDLETEDEYYRFTWAGKSMARREAIKPSTATLRPCKQESVLWDSTQNLFLEGENLEVLKLLQKSYANKIKVIYIDPPYNTGKDFVYKDNYSDNLSNYLELTGQLDGAGRRLSTNTESDGRYHSNWLNMLYPRLKLAFNLLKDTGVIFISIDDSELYNLKKICDEIFGDEQFVLNIAVNRTSEIATNNIVSKHEYILVYCKSINDFKVTGVTKYSVSRGTVGNPDQTMPVIEFPEGLSCYGIDDGRYETTRKIEGGNENIENFDPIEVRNGKLSKPVRLKAKWRSSNDMRNFFDNDCMPTEAKISGLIEEIYFESDRFVPQIKKLTFEKLSSLISNNRRGSMDLEKLKLNSYFDFPKSVELIQSLIRLIKIEKDEYILDFFAGSCTTAHATLQLNSEDDINRKFICVQLPELTSENSEAFKAGYKNIADIGKERIRRAGEKILKDKQTELEQLKNKVKGKILQDDINQQINQLENIIETLDIGFKVFKLDSSNIIAWDGDPEKLEQTLFNASSNIKENRTEDDILYEILLKYGIDLVQPIEQKVISGKTVFNIGGGALFICLADDITTNIADGIGNWKEDIKPATCKVILKDTGFTDVEKTNSMQILKRYGIEEVNTI